MVHVMKVIINRVKNVDTENSNGQMEVNILENFMIIIFMVKGPIHGVIKEFTAEIGKIIKWMEKESSFGPTVDDTKEDIKMIKKKVTGYLNGNLKINKYFFNK